VGQINATTTLTGQPDVALLGAISAGTCKLEGQSLTPAILRVKNGTSLTLYRHDTRLTLIDNTLGNPATAAKSETHEKSVILRGTHGGGTEAVGICPTAPRTFLNEDSCRREPGLSESTND